MLVSQHAKQTEETSGMSYECCHSKKRRVATIGEAFKRATS